jgi:hypothetical protein
MEGETRFAMAIRRIDDANRLDPRTDVVEGAPYPRELHFAERVYTWVERLDARPSEPLRLAARAHTLRRWEIPRDRYPRTNPGYHAWRDALAEFHAEEAAKILRNVGYDEDLIEEVRVLITREQWPQNSDACTLEDADCLAFLELKLETYLDQWDEQKAVRILRRTLRKMSPTARELAHRLDLTLGAHDVLDKAAAG